MKTLSIGVLLFLLSIVAYAVALSGAGAPLSETRAAPHLAAPAQLSDPRVLDAVPGTQAQGATRDDTYPEASLSTFVFLHQTWHEGVSAPTPMGFGVCPD